MSKNSDGEVYGAKALNLAIIGASALILMGVLWQPAPAHQSANKSAAQVEQVVAKVPAARPTAG